MSRLADVKDDSGGENRPQAASHTWSVKHKNDNKVEFVFGTHKRNKKGLDFMMSRKKNFV